MAPRQNTRPQQRQAAAPDVDERPFAPMEGEVLQAGQIASERVGGQELAAINLNEAQSIAMNLQRAEVDQQVATAKRYPRSVAEAQRRIESLACLDAESAAECLYSLERKSQDGGKTAIIGPSIRFAEIVQQCWHNCRVAARVTDLGKTHVEATGIFFDLEANVATAKSVQRRITTRSGSRYGDDMINVTANAAASIALRNAILAGVPKAVWRRAYEKALSVTRGTAETLNERKGKMVQAFKAQGASQAQIWQILDVKGEADVTLDTMVIAAGMLNALADGSTTLAALLADTTPQGQRGPGVADANGAPAQEQAKPQPPPQEQAKAAEPDHDPETGEVKDEPKADPPAEDKPKEQAKPEPEKQKADPPSAEKVADPEPEKQPPQEQAKADPPKEDPAPQEQAQGAADGEDATATADEAADAPQGEESGPADEGEAKEDQTPDPAVAQLAEYRVAIGGAKSWKEITGALTPVLGSEWWKTATDAEKDSVYALAWPVLQALPPADDVPRPSKSPAAFRLFMSACTDPEEIERVWSDLVSSAAYSGMKEPGRLALIEDKKRRKARLAAEKES